jgi:hypothetical protein
VTARPFIFSKINAPRSTASSQRGDATANKGEQGYDLSDVPVKARTAPTMGSGCHGLDTPVPLRRQNRERNLASWQKISHRGQFQLRWCSTKLAREGGGRCFGSQVSSVRKLKSTSVTTYFRKKHVELFLVRR